MQNCTVTDTKPSSAASVLSEGAVGVMVAVGAATVLAIVVFAIIAERKKKAAAVNEAAEKQ